ncbi:MAG: NTP transferase domain-containing protein [Alphaproteobacteria bacterium]|nr:NTP transferase domain-containing protein [Alphaproteobacteria bacterium]
MPAPLRIQPVIMCGGAGTRLWPMSRQARPKQFLALASERTLFQDAALRVAPAPGAPFAPAAVIGGAAHAEAIESQLEEAGLASAAVIAEPAPRNTAAVAGLAAAWASRAAPGALVLLLPADHHVGDPAAFRAAVETGAAAAARGAIVTFGVKPTEPHTGYGYIERGGEIAPGVYQVAAFREKPDVGAARRYLAGGAHFWNSGVFLFDPGVMLEELAAHAPDIRAAAESALDKARRRGKRIDLDADEFARCPSDSIDYAVMEKTSRAAVVGPIELGWSDIGSWSALDETGEHPAVYALDAEGCLVRTDGPFVGIIGVKDLIVVATGDAVLVAPKSRAQDVKKVVDELKARGRHDLL